MVNIRDSRNKEVGARKLACKSPDFFISIGGISSSEEIRRIYEPVANVFPGTYIRRIYEPVANATQARTLALGLAVLL